MKKKFRLVFIFLLQNFCLNIYSETINPNKNINFIDNNLEKKIFPMTSIKGNLFFTFGGIENNNNESINFTYENKLKIKTSFNENDKLLTIIESGNAFESPLNLDLQSKKGNNLKISTLQYQFKINDNYIILDNFYISSLCIHHDVFLLIYLLLQFVYIYYRHQLYIDEVHNHYLLAMV